VIEMLQAEFSLRNCTSKLELKRLKQPIALPKVTDTNDFM